MRLDPEADADEVARRARPLRFTEIPPLFVPDSASGMGQACARGGDRLDRQRRHVVGGGGAAGGAGRIRRDAAARCRWPLRSRCSASVSAASSPARSPTASASWRRSALSIAFSASAMSAPGCRPRCGNSSWCISLIGLGTVGDLRAADGGGLALVRALSRAGGDHRRQRQLCRRHDLAAAGQLGHADGRLAHHPYRASACSARWR